MWNQTRSNRIIGERERVKEHIMHVQRLRQVKPSIDTKAPPKPTHLTNNFKREMKNMERLSEIQYQNRVLLRKMLHIDLKAKPKTTQSVQRPKKASVNHQGLNSYNSLNRANRIKDLAKIIDQNKQLLDKLQNAKSVYNRNIWEDEHQKRESLKYKIQTNGDRYCKNPYFLHSLCTKAAPSQSMYPSQFGSKHFGTISEYGPVGHRGSLKQSNKQKLKSEGFYQGSADPPRLRNKIRPSSAPRNDMQSVGLKNKVARNSKKNRPHTGYMLPYINEPQAQQMDGNMQELHEQDLEMDENMDPNEQYQLPMDEQMEGAAE